MGLHAGLRHGLARAPGSAGGGQHGPIQCCSVNRREAGDPGGHVREAQPASGSRGMAARSVSRNMGTDNSWQPAVSCPHSDPMALCCLGA